MVRLATVMAVVGCFWQTTPRDGYSEPSARSGQLVGIGEHRLYLSCTGSVGTGPTVVFEAGGGGTADEWSAVRDRLSGDVRACAYDRAGLGRSDPGPTPRTMHQEIFELHALLQAASERPPYVLVGQSIGGLLVRMYAAAYPDEVVGLVLVDPTHESAVLGSLRYGGMVRLREKAAGISVPQPRRSIRGGPPDNSAADYMAEEFQQVFLARQRAPQTLGQLPLIVLAAGRRPTPPPGITAEHWKSLRDERDEQIKDLVNLSSHADFVLDDGSGHSIHTDNPELVAKSISRVRDAAIGGRLSAEMPPQ